MSAGVALPGAPGIIVGHNRRIAWGITNLHYDVQDLYIEKLDERTGRYLFQRPGRAGARRARNHPRERPGPGRGGDLGDARTARSSSAEGSERMTLRWTAARARHAPVSRFSTSIARRTGSSSPPRLRAFRARDRISSMPTWTATSDTMRRANCRSGAGIRGDVPVDGASGDFEWDGYIPFEELPVVVQSARRA